MGGQERNEPTLLLRVAEREQKLHGVLDTGVGSQT